MNQLSKDGVQVVAEKLAQAFSMDNVCQINGENYSMTIKPEMLDSMAQAAYRAILDLPEMVKQREEIECTKRGERAADQEVERLLKINARLREALEMVELIPSTLGAERLTVWSARVQDPARFMDLRKQALNPAVAGGEQKMLPEKFAEMAREPVGDRECDCDVNGFIRMNCPICKWRDTSAANQQVDNALGGFEATLTVPAGSASMPINPDEFVVSNASASIGTIAQSHDLSQIKREAERDCKRSEDDH